MANTPINTHADVEACLQDILNAVKGEEVRGSIYDAIQLIDTRSKDLDRDIRNSVDSIVDSSVNSNINVPIHPIIMVRTTSLTTKVIQSINVTYSDIRAVAGGLNAKTIASTLIDSSLNVVWHNVPCSLLRDGDVLSLILRPQIGYTYQIQWINSKSDPTCLFMQDSYQHELIPGDGIDITGNVISVSYPNGDTEVY
jgi:hypothetical protein